MTKQKRPTFSSELASPDIVKNTIPLDQIGHFSLNPRIWFDQTKLEQLAESIKDNDLISGIIVRRVTGKPHEFEVIVGERRVLASRLAGLVEIKAEIRELSDRQALILAREENNNREDPSPIEDTISTLNIIQIDTGLEHEEIKGFLYKMSKGRNVPTDFTEKVMAIFDDLKTITFQTFVKDRLRLLNLPSEIFTAIQEGRIEPTKGVLIARVKDDDQRQELLNTAIFEKYTIAQIKERIAQFRGKKVTDYSNTPTDELTTQVKNTFKKLSRKQSVWSDPSNRKKIESLLKTINSLVEA